MKLEKDLWLEDGYYIDFDQLGQFRIIGPNNHLYCGLIDIPRHKIQIKNIKSRKEGRVTIDANFTDNRVNLYYPAMDDIRTVRTHAGSLTFLEARKQFSNRLVPQNIKKTKKSGKTYIEFIRSYQEKFYYKTTFIFTKACQVKKIQRPFTGFRLLCRSKKIPFQIIAETNDLGVKSDIKNIFVPGVENINLKIFNKKELKIRYFWQRTKVEIDHLIKWSKTSGDRFGTVFPRDWMEAADIGIHDFSSEARSYIYKISLKNVDNAGQGWHEDVVGEFRYEYELSGKEIFDRHMIDIEPHYLMALEYLPENFLLDKGIRAKLQCIAKYILKNARKHNFIIFKKLPKEQQKNNEKYYDTGNWRDSSWAFKKVSDIIAPFDINAVFYPKALMMIKKYQKKLGIKANDLDILIKKWGKKKDLYRFKNEDGLWAYALALYGDKKKKKVNYKKLKVNHLDESYFYTYLDADEAEITSFCKRLLDKKYLYTPSGPLLIAKNNGLGYTNREYHGLVTWIKQTAYVILGLSKHLKISITENWSATTQKLIKKTILIICEQTINTCITLNAIPELYWDDHGTPKFFPITSSKVQLWSAVGIRRIIRKYIELKTDPVYKKI